MKLLLRSLLLILNFSWILAQSDNKCCYTYQATTLCINSTNCDDVRERTHLHILGSTGKLQLPEVLDLPNIKSLIFSSNNISEINSRFFDKFPNLEELMIWGNINFPNITKSLLKPCMYLKKLEIYFNYNISRIEENVLKNFPYLEILTIRSENIRHLGKNDMSRLGVLKNLSIDLTQLRKIEAKAFDRLRKLEYLSLMANHFLVINPRIFQRLANLKELNLIYANLNNVDFVKNLKNLVILNLAGNNIESVSAEQFRDLTSLIKVDLSFTGIKHIEILPFLQVVPNLEEIDVTCHKLENELYDFVEFADRNVKIIDKYAGTNLTC